MYTIEKDISQWDTVSTLLNWLNENNIQLIPYIIDIGGYDGKTISNSWSFIKELKWKGVLVEPNPESCKKITQNYEPYKNEVDILICSFALNTYDGQVQLKMGDDPALASVKNLLNQTNSIMVDCFTPQTFINKLFNFEGFYPNNVGILSIDTEGHDSIILIDWMKNTDVRPQIIITESWPQQPFENAAKFNILEKSNYKQILQCGENSIFIIKELLNEK